jgi:hypothetical protein
MQIRSRDDHLTKALSGGSMTLALEQANEIVRSIVRTIDKRAEFRAQNVAEGDRPAVTGTLTMRRHSTTVTIPIDALTAAGENATRRHELRTTIKRAFDRMMFTPTLATSTKMTRASTSADGFFRPPSGGSRGRR